MSKVRAQLNPGEALCEYVRYRVCSEKGIWSPHYGAIVLRADRDPAWVPLGPAEPIDREVAAIFSAQAVSVPSEGRLRKLLRAPYRSVVEPLAKACEGCKRLIISPDSALTQLSFAVLLDGEEEFLGVSREIVYVTNARDLLAASRTNWKGKTLLVADPQFDAAGSSVPYKVDKAVMLATLPFGRENLPVAKRLPGAAEEAKAVEAVLSSLGCVVTSLQGEEASEEKLTTSLAEAPAILHFATHGYVLPASRRTFSGLSSSGLLSDILPTSRSAAEKVVQGMKASSNPRGFPLPPGRPIPAIPPVGGAPSGEHQPTPLAVDQPLERSILALASARRTFEGWKDMHLRDPSRDGLLSAAEVSRFDLSQNCLTVLSACDTAVGDPVAGEGVMGLRRGFLMAGSGHLLVTFWKQDAVLAPRMMERFYQELGRTGHPATALSRLQAAALKNPADFGGFSRMVFVAGAFGVSTTGKLPVSVP